MELLNYFKKHYLVTLSEAKRSKWCLEQTLVVRAWTAWEAFNIAKGYAESKPKRKNGKWVVYDMKKL